MTTTWIDFERAPAALHEHSMEISADQAAALPPLSVLPPLSALPPLPPPPCTPMTKRRRQAEALERQREPRQSSSQPLAAEVMRGVLAGEWVITDHFQGEGRRFLIAQRCRPGDGRALSERERQVLALALQGHSNKFIAYELGLTSSTVATHLRRSMAKLRVESREALIQALPIEIAMSALGRADKDEKSEGATETPGVAVQAV